LAHEKLLTHEKDYMILIAGDSWGCGEWGTRATASDRHNGLSTFFSQDNKEVLNLSVAGACNFEIANIVSNFLDNNNRVIQDIERILVFQSNWNRDWRRQHDFDIDTDLKHPYPQVVGRFIERFYFMLNQSALKHNIQIEIIGGCSDTIWFDDIKKDYPGLKIACQSMINLLLFGSDRVAVPVHSLWLNNKITLDFIARCKILFDQRNLDLLLQDIDLGLHRQNQMKQNHKYFADDWVHANSAGHELLYAFLHKL